VTIAVSTVPIVPLVLQVLALISLVRDRQDRRDREDRPDKEDRERETPWQKPSGGERREDGEDPAAAQTGDLDHPAEPGQG
jgi:hypothetical protein